ncbi:type II 3-dehydroquinate dehydratase [Myxococcota bacterium]|nr:type II 3-dehydroquinate dehydratase [Myxococcota bacterium]MBU1429346.1 type II 3-dehydroquinate dehydratase [Myxococcota bacterium]MBU1899596.1 type II 3-dehydroquinate dehydratase [Myxococcota bacterium]
MTRVLLLNGPNLNRLGLREPALYGVVRLADIEARLTTLAAALDIELRCAQSNHEGALIDAIHAAAEDCQGIILNAGGYTHTSVALRDAILSVGLPLIEVHLTNLAKREEFRQKSYLSGVALGVISGFGAYSYELALRALDDHLKRSACVSNE